jgi:hypothetical protein
LISVFLSPVGRGEKIKSPDRRGAHCRARSRLRTAICCWRLMQINRGGAHWINLARVNLRGNRR